MTDIFHTKIRQSLANPGLQAALDANAERRMRARITAFASLPEELDIMRQRANEVRTNIITNRLCWRLRSRKTPGLSPNPKPWSGKRSKSTMR